jgi:hypothetical protein
VASLEDELEPERDEETDVVGFPQPATQEQVAQKSAIVPTKPNLLRLSDEKDIVRSPWKRFHYLDFKLSMQHFGRS